MLVTCFFLTLSHNSELHHITSHHIEKTEAGLKGLYIREIANVIEILICYY